MAVSTSFQLVTQDTRSVQAAGTIGKGEINQYLTVLSAAGQRKSCHQCDRGRQGSQDIGGARAGQPKNTAATSGSFSGGAGMTRKTFFKRCDCLCVCQRSCENETHERAPQECQLGSSCNVEYKQLPTQLVSLLLHDGDLSPESATEVYQAAITNGPYRATRNLDIVR